MFYQLPFAKATILQISVRYGRDAVILQAVEHVNADGFGAFGACVFAGCDAARFSKLSFASAYRAFAAGKRPE